MSDPSNGPDKQVLLSALQAHGRDFLASFNFDDMSRSKRKRRKIESEQETHYQGAPGNSSSDIYELKEDDWHGFDSETYDDTSSGDSEDDVSGETGSDICDDEFRSDAPSSTGPQVVTFLDTSSKGTGNTGNIRSKSFMSSKISKLNEDLKSARTSKLGADEEGYEEERSNLRNDALLHKLIHTQLVAGPSAHDLNIPPAERRRALEGRIIELAAGAKLGKGESTIRQKERGKAAKRVRLGLERKVEEQSRKSLEEAKDLGNYHRSIKHLFEAPSKKQADRRKRDRGLKLGVGRFRAGTLQLNKDDVSVISGSGSSGRNKGKGIKRRRL